MPDNLPNFFDLPWSSKLPPGVENDFQTWYMLRHIPTPDATNEAGQPDEGRRRGTMFPTFAIRLEIYARYNVDYGHTWDWVPLDLFWASYQRGPDIVPVPKPDVPGQLFLNLEDQIFRLQRDAGDLEDRASGLAVRADDLAADLAHLKVQFRGA